MNQTGASVSPYYARKLKLSEHELEQIQAFLDTVHETLHIPLVLQESNPEYPIVLAENHQGMSVEDQENLIHFIQEKYQLDKTKIILKILISSRQNRVHIGLPKALIRDFLTPLNPPSVSI